MQETISQPLAQSSTTSQPVAPSLQHGAETTNPPFHHYPSSAATGPQQPRSNYNPTYQPSTAPPVAQSQYSYYSPAAANPYGSHGQAGDFASQDSNDMMATHTMRPTVPSMYTPTSHSPVPASSSHDPRNRLLYQAPSPQLYYGQYNVPNSQPYMQHASAAPQPQFSPHHPVAMSYPPGPSLHSQPSHHMRAPDNSSLSGLGQPHKRPASQMGPPSLGHQRNSDSGRSSHGSSSNQTANPGPIPASTPRVISQSSDGVQKISFEYSRERIKTAWTINCNIHEVDTKTLTKEFKENNCVYPRACCSNKSDYKGNRWNYENECNEIAWALASLNEGIQNKRGLIQRAVDSWRNSNADNKMRSRRVRRMAKNNKRQISQQVGSPMGARSGLGPTPGSSIATSSAGTWNDGPQSYHTQQLPSTGGRASTSSGMDGVEGSATVATPMSYSASPASHYMYKTPPSGSDITAASSFTGSHPRGTAQFSGVSIGDHTPRSRYAATPSIPSMVSSNVAGPSLNEGDLFESPSALYEEASFTIRDPHQNLNFEVKPLLEPARDTVNDKFTIFLHSKLTDASDMEGEDMSQATGMQQQLQLPPGRIRTATVPKGGAAAVHREQALNELGNRLGSHMSSKISAMNSWKKDVSRGITMLQRCLDKYRAHVAGSLSQKTGSCPEHLQERPGKQRWLSQSHGHHLAVPITA